MTLRDPRAARLRGHDVALTSQRVAPINLALLWRDFAFDSFRERTPAFKAPAGLRHDLERKSALPPINGEIARKRERLVCQASDIGLVRRLSWSALASGWPLPPVCSSGAAVRFDPAGPRRTSTSERLIAPWATRSGT